MQNTIKYIHTHTHTHVFNVQFDVKLPQDHPYHQNMESTNHAQDWQLKTAQVATEMRRFNLSILGISESRWTASGQKQLKTGELLLFSANEHNDAPHTQGVALMLSKTAQAVFIGREADGPQIITASTI